jgi:hypothetical protein
MRLNADISDGNRLFIQVYPTSAFLNTYEYVYMYVIVHNVQYISVRVCWIDVNEMCTAEKLSPDR